MYRQAIKPLFDFVAALVLIILLSPVFVGCCLLLSLTNRGKVFFTQRRPGLHGRLFTMIKFKTMQDTRDGQGNLLSDDERLTRVGRLIRKTSVDELPQLLNVISGAMSLVGPRPLLAQYLSLYNEHQHRRHDVKPGITGWAQIHGRNKLTWQQKFELDVWYVDHISFYIDLKVLILTALTVIKSEGIGDGSSSTMKNFEGN